MVQTVKKEWMCAGLVIGVGFIFLYSLTATNLQHTADSRSHLSPQSKGNSHVYTYKPAPTDIPHSMKIQKQGPAHKQKSKEIRYSPKIQNLQKVHGSTHKRNSRGLCPLAASRDDVIDTSISSSTDVTDMTSKEPNQRLGVTHRPYYQTKENTTIQHASSFLQTQKQIQESRLQNIRNFCSMSSVFTTNKFKKKKRPKYYYSSTYNVTYCKVQKSGSTFWTQAFAVFKYGTGHIDCIFNRIRAKVHLKSREFMVKFTSDKCQNSPAILVSRDPYSRLLSAYIDKIYLPLMFNVIRKIAHKAKSPRHCPTDTSFQDFLDFVVRQALQGKGLNRHWAPILSLCRPCDVDVALLVKQETFSNDVKYALETFNVKKNEQQILLQALHENRSQFTIPGIVGSVFKKNVKRCLTETDIAKRLWFAFQIQGFIRDTVPFPEYLQEGTMKNKGQFSELVLESIRAHPMTSDERRQQRRRALVSAYQAVHRDIIKQIQQIYKADFELYGYSTEAPLSL